MNIYFPQKLEIIGESAFEECTKLNKENLPTELKHLESNAFAFCEALKKLDIPDNTQMSIGTSERSVGYVGYMITFFSPVGSSRVTYYSEQYQYAQGSDDFDELPTMLVVSDGSYAHNQLIGFEGYGLKFEIK